TAEKRGNVTLLADQHLTVDFHLQVASSHQTVSVSDIPPTQVDTTSSTLSEVVEKKRIVDLPLDGRNPVQLALLVPGTVHAPANNADQGEYKTLPAAITISASGSRANQTAFNLDGSSNNDIYTNVNQPFPFPDALQEFSVQTSNYTARYGGNSGAVVNAITASGTNAFHGDLFEFNRNAVFNARNHFASVRDQLKRNQFGGVIGGPIIRDKTFFFFGYQQTQIRDTQNGHHAFVPTPVEMQGDFSAVKAQIFNPTTKAPYAGNQIPVDQFDPAAVKFASSYLPKSTSSTGEIDYSLPISQSFNEYVVRGDQTLSQNDHLFARYYLDHYTDNPSLTPGNYLAVVSRSAINSHNAIVGETHTFTPNLLNDVRLSLSRVATNAGPPPGSISVADLGVAVSQPAQFAKALDGISVSGYFSTSSFPPSIMNRNDYMISDDVSWIHGRHTFAFGGMLARGLVVIRDAYLAGGTFSFTADNSGDALASFLLGSIRTFKQGNGEFKDDRDWVAALYAQDDYHVSRRLTLNLGLRWAPYVPWYEANGRVEQFRAANYYAGIHSTHFPNAPAGLLFPGDAGMPKYGVTNTYTNFSPRVGFAFDPTGQGKTSLRGGFGLFYDAQQVGIENNRFVDVSPFSTQVAITTPAGSFSNPYQGITNPFPAPAVPSPDSSFPAPVLAVTYDPAHGSRMLPPVTYNYNLTVEHQFPKSIMMRAAYVGSQSRHQTETIELNPAVYMPGSKLSTDKRRIYQGYASIGQGTNDLSANYNSLQLSAQRRMTWLTLLANYTYSKSLDDVPVGQGNAGIASQNVSALPVTNPLRHWFDYGRSDFDYRHILTASYVWTLPALKDHGAFPREILGGWETTGIVNYQSGQALTPLAGSDRSQTGLGQDRAMQVSPNAYGGDACGSKQPCVSYLNPAAFVTNYTAASYPLGTAGNVRKGAFGGPAYTTWDAGLMKNFAITEATRLQFHAEFFNVLNHTNLGNPNQTANSPAFGSIQGMNGQPRVGQLALKLMF
ncbi:MAG TPA: hypothetical protein VN541_05820, partial [Tepidisphaeraceae bacterium]|nr:hypothetical protein [Tepidisphaeraceae bacterium]